MLAMRKAGHAQSEIALSGNGGDSAVGAPCLAVEILGNELQVEGLPCRTICQPC